MMMKQFRSKTEHQVETSTTQKLLTQLKEIADAQSK